jgi:hypothetical protein
MNTKEPGKETPFEFKEALHQQKPGMTSQTGAKSTETAKDLGDKTRQSTAEAAEQLKNMGAEALGKARQQAEHAAGTQKEYLIERLSHCGAASRKAAEQLRNDNDTGMAHYADVIADQFDKGVSYIRSHDLRAVARDAENLARRHPEVFLGGMLIAGLGLARFLKASSHHQNPRVEERSNMVISEEEDIHLTPVEVPVSSYAHAASGTADPQPYSGPAKI